MRISPTTGIGVPDISDADKNKMRQYLKSHSKWTLTGKVCNIHETQTLSLYLFFCPSWIVFVNIHRFSSVTCNYYSSVRNHVVMKSLQLVFFNISTPKQSF